MLDQSIQYPKTQKLMLETITKAVVLASAAAPDNQVVDILWNAMEAALTSDVQFMIVLDGLEQMRNSNASVKQFLGRFQEIISNPRTASKLIVFSRLIPRDVQFTNAQLIDMDVSNTGDDLKAAVNDIMALEGQFYGVDDDDMETISKTIVSRSQGNFVWAQLALHFVSQQKTTNEMYTAANAAPQALNDLIQHHLDTLNLDHPDTRVILALLAVSERPLQVKEINQLLTIDSKGPHLVSRVPGSESETFRPVSPLVVARDGYVTFRHPTIRQHIRELAESMRGDYSNKGPFPFNLQEANYELLMRSVAWVKFCVEEDVEISFDKLRADDRDALFDTYPLLEYTSRYWYTHLLESPMTTEEGAINFVTPFKRALPDSTLFAQLELTCFESQFSRSSILELYRLSVDVRGTVLGEDATSYLQSLIFSGRAAHKADTGAVNEHLYKAWILSRTKLGSSSAIASSLAELVATTVRTNDWDNAPRGDTTERRREEALRSLIATESEGSPLGFPSRFGYLAILVKMFKDNGDEAGAYSAAKKFYHNSTRQYGSYSSESSKSADFLTHHFDIPNNDEMALTLARSKYENMLRTLPVTDDRRIAYTLYMARLYEQQNQNDQAEAVLANLWGGLSAKDIGSTPHWDKKTKVAFAYYQFLRRHGRAEEAEVIMRDLTADFETDGVQSPEMLEQAETLRNEARNMQLTDLESMLSMLIWRYYKKAGLEHSPQAVTLAETLVADSATSNAESLAVLSTQERVFLHELIDSIASSENRLSMSVLILCHNLATVHISDEEWQHGSECVMAVLRHAWPTVEDAESESKFPSDRAPQMANLAMDLAYCSFQRLNVPKATVVYGNAFKAAIIADKVSVPVVDSVVKTVVGFYEETFQYSVALVLLRQVSQFYLSRLGVSDKHTIDSLYHKGDLAARLERTQDAENSYATIYKASLRNGKIGSVGVRAAVALLALFEANKKWDSALEVYRHLWPTLVRFDETDGYDRALLEGLLDKTYTGYMSILSSRATPEGYSERYRVSSEHLRLCKKLYGHSHNKTLQATLGHAGVCEDNDKNIDESIALYQQVLRVNEWVPSSQATRSLHEMSHTLPISTKHKLAKLHLRKQSRDHEAGTLYKEEMALARKRYGHSSTTTLRWLREVAMFYAIQNTMESWSKGSETLGAHADETIRTTEHQETLIDRAHRLAEIYIECGYIDAGNKLIDELHQQIVYERPASQKSVDSYQPAVFVASFEEHFRKRQSYSQIMDELNREGSVFGSFEDSLSSRDLVPTLASGERLHRVQADQKRTSAAKETQSKLYTYFCNTLSVSHLQRRDVIRQFFNICRREVMFDDYNANIIVATSYEVKSLCDSLRFQDAADLAGAFHSFVHLTDGLRSYESVFSSLKLCLYLNGYDTSRCSDEKIANNMAIESKLLLQEIMANAKEINVQFSELPFSELNNLVTVLGEHELFEDLEVCFCPYPVPCIPRLMNIINKYSTDNSDRPLDLSCCSAHVVSQRCRLDRPSSCGDPLLPWRRQVGHQAGQ